MAERIIETRPRPPEGKAPTGGRKRGTLKQEKTDDTLPLDRAIQ
jgi:hypothetical protein